jgi:hypothetical protein
MHQNMKAKSKVYTHHALLRDLKEIKAVLDVEFQLMRELVRVAITRQAVGFGF